MCAGPRFIHVLELLLTSQKSLMQVLGGTNVVVKGMGAEAVVAADVVTPADMVEWGLKGMMEASTECAFGGVPCEKVLRKGA